MAYELIGQRFGKLTVKSLLPDTSHKERHWLCECDCGNEYVATSYGLVHGVTTQCRECSIKQISVSNTKHGCGPKRLHEIYTNMKTRCHNRNYELYHRYGGRGICVCDEWDKSYEAFRSWAFSSGYSDELSLDRIDNNGNYCPENCKWSSVMEQANNRHTNRLITYNGETDTLANWARRKGMKYSVLQHRLDAGGDVDRAFDQPVRGC